MANTPPTGYRLACHGGHPRTVPYSKMSSKGCTELQISLSGAKNADESNGVVRFCVAPQKTGKRVEKLHEIFENYIFCCFNFFFFRKHPNVSARIRMRKNRSVNVEKLRENVEKLRENVVRMTTVSAERSQCAGVLDPPAC